METYRRIDVGIDLSLDGDEITSGSRRAARRALGLASRFGASTRLVHSTHRDLYYDPLTMGTTIVQEGPSGRGQRALEALLGEFHAAGSECELVVMGERPALAMARAALRGETDLVVVGKRNDVERNGRKLGSVSSNLLRTCPSSVWVVATEGSEELRLILAATDLSPVGDQAVERASQLAQGTDCELHVVHAVQMPFSMIHAMGRTSEEERRERILGLHHEATERIRALLERCGGPPGAAIHVGCTSPVRALHEGVDKLKPDLVVMGTISRGGIAGLLVGNTAERVLGELDCSILTVKPDDFRCPVELED